MELVHRIHKLSSHPYYYESYDCKVSQTSMIYLCSLCMYMYVCTWYACTYARMYVCMYVCIYVDVYLYTSLYMCLC